MALLGSLIRKAIELNQTLSPRPKPPAIHQEEQLRWLLNSAKDTSIGLYYGFREMYGASDPIKAFQQEVPIHTYESMHERWWQKQQKYPDITWPGKPSYFALSSGTTGKSSKRIPVTEEFTQSMREVGLSMIRELPNYDLPTEVFEAEIMTLSSSANLTVHEYGHEEGEISGINVSNFPGWYDLFVRPGQEIARISDWEQRLARIVEEAPNWNIGSLAGIPSWNLLMLQAVIREHGLNHIHEIWPNFTVFASGGVAFETYRKDFEAISGKPLTIMDTYLASEGFFGYTANPGSLAMRLAVHHGYFYEFIPFDERGVDDQGGILEDPLSLTIEDVELDTDYVLVISSCAGAWRYVIGDTIKFTQLDPPEIKISGRTKFFLNVVGSQLSEEKLDAAILEVSESMGISVNEYVVGAMKNEDDQWIHQWVVVTDSEPNTDALAEKLDEALKSANKNYGVARGKALKGLHVRVIDKGEYHRFLDSKKKKGGQVKTPKVMSEEKIRELLTFLGS